MFFFMRLAAKNIVKDKRYAFTIMTVVFICVFVSEFTVGYMDGFKQKLMGDALDNTGHISIYNKKYYDSLDFSPLEYNMEFDENFAEKIKRTEGVKFIRPEINFGAVANSVKDSTEASVKAIKTGYNNPVYKKRKKSVKKGRFIKGPGEFAVGYKLAELIEVDVGGSIILLTMDQYGSMSAIEGKITGLMHTKNPLEDESLIICSLTDAQNLLALYDNVTQIIVNVKDPWLAPKTAAEIDEALSKNITAVEWQKEQAYLVGIGKIIDIWVYIVMAIILVVAAMGISNSFLMNIMGRLPDFGVLRSMGLSRLQMFAMIMAESFTLGVMGTVAGLIPGAGLVYYFQANPINYGEMAEVFEAYKGLDAVIGTALTIEGIVSVFLAGILVSVLASVYPAAVAIKKKPSEILRLMQ